MNLGLIWQGAFIDASKHWNDRGPGNQIPLGDNVVQLRLEPPFARLENDAAAWPKGPARTTGYKFLGYRLNKKREPEFRYRLPGATVADFPQPSPGKASPGLQRTLTLSAEPVEGTTVAGMLFFRAARSKVIKPLNGGAYGLSEGIRLTVSADRPVKLRESEGEWELLVPVDLSGGSAKISLDYSW